MKKYTNITLIIPFLSIFLINIGLCQETSEQKSTSEVILTQEDFVKNNCESVGDALQTITGVYVNSTG